MNNRQSHFAAFVAAHPSPHGPTVFHTCCVCHDKSPTYKGYMPKSWQTDAAGREYCKRRNCKLQMLARSDVAPIAITPISKIRLAQVPASAVNHNRRAG